MNSEIVDQIHRSIQNITAEELAGAGIMTRPDATKYVSGISDTSELVILGRVADTLASMGYNIQNMSMQDIRHAIQENGLQCYLYDKTETIVETGRGGHLMDDEAIDFIRVTVPVMYISKNMKEVKEEYKGILGRQPERWEGALAVIEYARKILILKEMGAFK